jgi:putative cardiolipin synthase
VIADAPEKASGDSAAPTVAEAHVALLASARSEVLIASPYFVPDGEARRTLAGLRARDVGVSVLTNSLATTDEPLVHFGYARYRGALLDMGVALYELMPDDDDAPEAAEGPRGSLGRLHAKLAVVDGRWLSIGSMNMDRRSARSNTESTIVIDDREIAGEVAAFLEHGRVTSSYTLRLGEGGKQVEWVGREAEAVLRAEPRRPGGPGLKPRLASFFVSEELL